MERGKWVFFQNCHLSPSFMPSLERLIEQIDPDKVKQERSLVPVLPAKMGRSMIQAAVNSHIHILEDETNVA